MISLKFHHKSVLGYIQEDIDWALKSPERARQGWPSHLRGSLLHCTSIASSFVIATGHFRAYHIYKDQMKP